MTDISIRIHMLVTSAVSSVVSKLQREECQDLIEYAMLGGLIAAAIVAVGIALFTTNLTSLFTGIGGCIDFTAGGCTPGF